MKWLVIIIFAIVFIVYIIRLGNDEFWRLVNKNPLIAYRFFMSNECWYVVHPNEEKNKPKEGDWTGPFSVIVPGIGRIKVFGKEDEIELKQKEFIEALKKNE